MQHFIFTYEFLRFFFHDILISCFGWETLFCSIISLRLSEKYIFGGILILRILDLNREITKTSCLKAGVLENFAKFTGKHLCQNFFLNKVAGASVNISLDLYWKRESGTGVFMNLRNFQEHLFRRTPPGDYFRQFTKKRLIFHSTNKTYFSFLGLRKYDICINLLWEISSIGK